MAIPHVIGRRPSATVMTDGKGDVRFNGEVIGHVTAGSFTFHKPAAVGMTKLDGYYADRAYEETAGDWRALELQRTRLAIWERWQTSPLAALLDPKVTAIASVPRGAGAPRHIGWGWWGLGAAAHRRAFLRQIRSRRPAAERGER